jgi:hypothetical protein
MLTRVLQRKFSAHRGLWNFRPLCHNRRKKSDLVKMMNAVRESPCQSPYASALLFCRSRGHETLIMRSCLSSMPSAKSAVRLFPSRPGVLAPLRCCLGTGQTVPPTHVQHNSTQSHPVAPSRSDFFRPAGATLNSPNMEEISRPPARPALRIIWRKAAELVSSMRSVDKRSLATKHATHPFSCKRKRTSV